MVMMIYYKFQNETFLYFSNNISAQIILKNIFLNQISKFVEGDSDLESKFFVRSCCSQSFQFTELPAFENFKF